MIGNRTKVKVVKNKVAPPFKIAEFDIVYGEGISKAGDLLDLAVEQQYRRKERRLVLLSGERIGQGRENAKRFLADHADMCLDIENKLRLGFGLQGVQTQASPAVETEE